MTKRFERPFYISKYSEVLDEKHESSKREIKQILGLLTLQEQSAIKMLFGIELPIRSRKMTCEATGMDMVELELLENKIHIMVQRLQRKKKKDKT